MKFFVSKITILVLAVLLFISCGTLPPPSSKKPYRPLSNALKEAVVGTVQTNFQTRQVPGYREDNRNISNMAYIELLKKAKETYGNDVDVHDITWTDVRSIYGETGWIGHEFSAIGKVIVFSELNRLTGIEDALAKAAKDAMRRVSKNSAIAIIYITAQDDSTVNYIAGELEFILVSEGYIICDRSQLDLLRKEQNFQINGEVNDASAVSIGKFLGASVVVTGKIDGKGNLRRLRLRVLDTQTAQVIGAASEKL